MKFLSLTKELSFNYFRIGGTISKLKTYFILPLILSNTLYFLIQFYIVIYSENLPMYFFLKLFFAQYLLDHFMILRLLLDI